MRRKPIIYLDTNIVRDCFSGRNKLSVILLREFKKSKLRCITSTLSTMELYDTEKENISLITSIKKGYEGGALLSKRRNTTLNSTQLRKINSKIDLFFKRYKFIEIWDLEKDDDWDLAKGISSSTNIATNDAIHLMIAIKVGVNLLITKDSHFLTEAEDFIKTLDLWDQIRVSNVENALKVLEEMGFKNTNVISSS